MADRRCSRCGEARPAELVCPSCGAIQPLGEDVTYFTALGLPEHPAVDTKALEERYYALSRQLHPDRHQTGDRDQMTRSVRASALVNQAYRTLRDVETRGRYWLKRLGDDLGRDNNQVPAPLAAFVFDVQEKLAEMRAARGAHPDLRREVSAIHAQIEERIDSERAVLGALLDEWPREPSNGTEGAERTRRLKETLSRLSYLKTLDREVRAGLEG